MHDLDLPEDKVVKDTPLDWYRRKMQGSSITSNVATLSGLKLCAFIEGAKEEEEDYPFIFIPYFTPSGEQTSFYRRRVYDDYLKSPVSYEERKKGRGGKYRNPKGQRNRIYWPALEDQTNKLNDVDTPLLICEGEFKAICAKSHALGSGISLAVCGIGGVQLEKHILDELKSIPMVVTAGGKEHIREVFIAMDWNGRGDSYEHSHAAEQRLLTFFTNLGASCHVVRWETKATTEQKLDDWLSGGGDLNLALQYSMAKSTAHARFLQTEWDYYNERYVICAGKFIPIRVHAQRLAKESFEIMEAKKYNDVEGILGKKNTVYGAAAIWGKQPKDERNIVDGFTFAPFPMGVAPERYVWREGRRMFNVAPPWPGTFAPWELDQLPDVSPFMNLLKRLCRGHEGWFLQFLAHAAQRPWERGHHVVVFSDDGGTGKGRLLDTLRSAFGPYCVPVGNAFKNDFNGHLESAILSVWSEPESHGRKDIAINAIIKNYSGDSDQMINHKYGNQYSVPNYGRLIVMTNNSYITAYDSTDRRLVVFGGNEQITPAEAVEYMTWLESGGVQAIREVLRALPLDGFKVFERGPLTDKWQQGIEDSAPKIIQFLEDNEMHSKDIWTAEAIIDSYKMRYGNCPHTAIGLGKDLARAGKKMRMINTKRTATLEGKQKGIKFYAIRGDWEDKSNDQWLDEAKWNRS